MYQLSNILLIMKSMKNRQISILLLGYSALASFLSIVFYSFAYTGVALSLVILASLVYIFKSDKSRFSGILFLLILILSSLIFFRANEFLLLLNIVFVFLLGSIMALPEGYFNANSGFLNFLISPVFLFFRSISIKNVYDLNLRQLLEDKSKPSREKTIEVLISLAISLILLLVIIPLLSSANPVFNKLLDNFLDLFYLKGFFKWFFSDSISIWIFRAIFFGLLAFFIPRVLTYVRNGQEKSELKLVSLRYLNFIIPKAIISIVLFIFFLTQLQFYFSTSETLLAMGITQSQYAREVFAQLLVVALIIFGLVYNSREKSKASKVLTVLLVLEGIFLTSIALKSVSDYSYNWGFTHKRLWGFTMVFWLYGIFSFFIYKYLKGLKDTVFIKGVVIFSGITLITVNVLNFDLLIYKYRKSTTHSGVDYQYLSNLSVDSGSYIDQVINLNSKIATTVRNSEEYYSYYHPLSRLLIKIDRLQKKYRRIDIRSFNLSEYLQYQKIKSIDAGKVEIQMPDITPLNPVR